MKSKKKICKVKREIRPLCLLSTAALFQIEDLGIWEG